MAALAIAIAAASGSAAQDAQIVAYGGGSGFELRGDSVRFAWAAASAKVTQSGDHAAISVDVFMRCGKRDFAGRAVAVGAVRDGRIARTARTASTNDPAGRLRIAYTLTASVSAQGVDGTVRATGRRGRRTCTQLGRRTFVTRPGVPADAKGPARARTTYRGVVGRETPDEYPAPIMLRTSRDGSAVLAAAWIGVAPCTDTSVDAFPNFTPRTRVRADGSFSRPERFRLSDSWARAHYRITFHGRFTVSGAVGQLRVQETVRSRRSGRVLTRCDSGLLPWSARP